MFNQRYGYLAPLQSSTIFCGHLPGVAGDSCLAELCPVYASSTYGRLQAPQPTAALMSSLQKARR